MILQKAEVELAEKSVLTNREGCNILKKENSCITTPTNRQKSTLSGMNRVKDIYKDVWSTYSEYEVKSGNAHPISRKNRYIVVDLPNFLRLRKGVKTREDFWLRLISRGPLQVPETEDPVFFP